ncbi:MAG TPA: 16S rRNA (uracil(1498)-N(3))-methyltransferase [Methylophilaceae bacterium]|jgi:16S rRNA (uracil1498-N3)-methyltransferase
MPRFHVPEKLSPGTLVSLPANAANHASRVLRMKVGDTAVLFNGDGNDYPCELTRVSKGEVCTKITDVLTNHSESPLQITLVQAISSGDRMDFTIQKAVELGVSRIQPVTSRRSIVKLSGERAEKRVEHWQNVVIAACEQCGRAVVPPVLPVQSLPEWLAHSDPHALKLLLAPDATQNLSALSAPTDPIHLLIGAEGGLAPDEISLAIEHGHTPIRLGKRILRTETAALTAIASLQTLWGDFK